MRLTKTFSAALVLLLSGSVGAEEKRLSSAEKIDAGTEALTAMRSDASVQVTESATRIVMEPTGSVSPLAVLYQPGAKVEARAYAAVLRPLAEAGHRVVIVKQPLGIAFLATGAFAAARADYPETTGWVLGGFITGLVAVMVSMFKPHLSKVAGSVYAVAQGVVLGAVSRAYETAYDGIVMQAVGATMGVFVVMLLLYRTGVIRVTEKYRRIVMGAMLGLMAFYLVSFVIGLFGAMPSFISGATPTGILFSIFVAGLAAASLAIDFDTIEWAERNKLPAYMEWYCALGLLVTLVWLYLEILRLISKLREN